MYRVMLYNWITQERIGEAYKTNVLPTPELLITHPEDYTTTWKVVNVMHMVRHPNSPAAEHGEPEYLQVMVEPGRGQFL